MLGIDLLSVVRSRHREILPILFVTAEERERGLVRALGQGADDYIAKPFHIPELRARVEALLRRAYPVPYAGTPFAVGPYHFTRSAVRSRCMANTSRSRASSSSWPCCCSPSGPYAVARPHLRTGLGPQFGGVHGTIDSHVSRIRLKLHVEPVNEVRLAAVYKHGYRLDHLILRTGRVPRPMRLRNPPGHSA